MKIETKFNVDETVYFTASVSKKIKCVGCGENKTVKIYFPALASVRSIDISENNKIKYFIIEYGSSYHLEENVSSNWGTINDLCIKLNEEESK